MQLNEFGRIIESEWLKTPQIREKVQLDEYMVMPNHFHGVIVLTDNNRGVLQYAPTNIKRILTNVLKSILLEDIKQI